MFQLVQDFATICHPSDSLPKSVWQSMPQGQWRKLPVSMGFISWTEIAMDHNLSHLSPCSKLLAILIPCCSPRFLHFLSLFLPSLSCFLSFKHYAGRFSLPQHQSHSSSQHRLQFPALVAVTFERAPVTPASAVLRAINPNSTFKAMMSGSNGPRWVLTASHNTNCNERNCWNR